MGNKPDLSDYVDVAERIREFRTKYPEGTLQAECQFTELDGRCWVVVKAYAFRTPDDPRPGTGLAWEVVPGKTPYTKDSELQNSESSAWGRAIIAVGAADAKKIASYEEVRNRQAPQDVTDNAVGRASLGALCEENGWPKEALAAVFQQRTGKAPRHAPTEELEAFVALVRSGAVTINVEGDPAG